ncbi:unnamed protein product, partial [Mesorhabditis belari]|uniref:Uncharacterized protein n=1 Tax=Mesorhabditis belari TaxID=2138241 RepID=A0AAF3ES61_9BILA
MVVQERGEKIRKLSRLTTEWKVNKDEAVRLIDFHIVLKNIEAAQQILQQAAIDLASWAVEEKVEPSKANAILGAFCSSPFSRAIHRSNYGEKLGCCRRHCC